MTSRVRYRLPLDKWRSIGHVNAFPLQTFHKTMAPRRVLWGFAVAAAVVLSIWLVVAAGLQQGEARGGTVPGLLPEVPSIVQADLPASASELAPAAGPEIAPADGEFSPR